jgi:hypothetical protein
MDRISSRFILDEMLQHKTEDFKTKVYRNVDRLRDIMFDKEDISIKTLALIILLEEINEKKSV